MKQVDLTLRYAGYCYANESHAIQGGRHKTIKFHALWGLIEHPDLGWILYDTGYAERFFDATKWFPNKIYALATKVVMSPAEEVQHQLREQGIQPEEIQHIIITHFHADHVAGLLDFPQATIYASRAALEQALTIPAPIAFSKGILKSLLPTDLATRTRIMEDIALPQEDPILGTVYDLFHDQSVMAVPLPGHAAGQIGILLETPQQPYFLIADACWLKASYTDRILPPPIVKLFIHSWQDLKASIHKVADYHRAHPDICIVPTHCWESTSPLVAHNANSDAL